MRKEPFNLFGLSCIFYILLLVTGCDRASSQEEATQSIIHIEDIEQKYKNIPNFVKGLREQAELDYGINLSREGEILKMALATRYSYETVHSDIMAALNKVAVAPPPPPRIGEIAIAYQAARRAFIERASKGTREDDQRRLEAIAKLPNSQRITTLAKKMASPSLALEDGATLLRIDLLLHLERKVGSKAFYNMTEQQVKKECQHMIELSRDKDYESIVTPFARSRGEWEINIISATLADIGEDGLSKMEEFYNSKNVQEKLNILVDEYKKHNDENFCAVAMDYIISLQKSD